MFPAKTRVRTFVDQKVRKVRWGPVYGSSVVLASGSYGGMGGATTSSSSSSSSGNAVTIRAVSAERDDDDDDDDDEDLVDEGLKDSLAVWHSLGNGSRRRRELQVCRTI